MVFVKYAEAPGAAVHMLHTCGMDFVIHKTGISFAGDMQNGTISIFTFSILQEFGERVHSNF